MRVLTLREASERYHVPLGTLRRAASAGRLHVTRIGSQRVVSPAEMERYKVGWSPRKGALWL